MKMRYLATGLMTGLAAAAIAAAPLAAANPTTITNDGRTTTTDRNGHNAIVVQPPNVSAPNSYGPYGFAW